MTYMNWTEGEANETGFADFQTSAQYFILQFLMLI